MKTKIHAFFLCAMAALFAVSAGWAADLTPDGDGGYYINMPVVGESDNLTITQDQIEGGLTSFKVYDDGGASGNYSSCEEGNTCPEEGNAHGYLEITVPAGYLVRVSGSIVVESNEYDNLTIYSGTAASGTKLLDAAGNENEDDAPVEFGPVISMTNVLTLDFLADYSGEESGLDLTVDFVEATESHSITVSDNITGGTFVNGPTEAMVGAEVSLAFTADNGYALTGVVIYDGTNYYDANVGQSGSDYQITFNMPYANVTVTPSFSLPYSFTIVTVDNGSISNPLSEAYVGQTISLTTTPAEGYFLKSVYVEVEGGNNFYARIGTGNNSNTATFTMPAANVTITPLFLSPYVAHFDANGCLDNGAYYHVECSNNVCTLSQIPVANPHEYEYDFPCWMGVATMGGETETWEEDYSASNALQNAQTLRLGSNIVFAGYNEADNTCYGEFEPISLGTGATFDGQGYTVSGLCLVDEPSWAYPYTFGFVKNAKTITDVTFDNAHIDIDNDEGGSIVGIVTAQMTQANSAFTDVHVTNSYVAGTQAGAFAGSYETYDGPLSISNSSIANTSVVAKAVGTQGVTVSAVGGYVGYVDGSVFFDYDDLDGATVEGLTNAGGLAGYIHVSGTADMLEASFDNLIVNATVSGNGNVGGLAGNVAVSSEVGPSVTVSNVAASGSVSASGMPANVKVGGFFGNLSLSTMNPGTAKIYASSYTGDVSFANPDEQHTLYMGPMFGYMEGGANLSVYGTYSNGGISYSGVNANNVNVGYIAGAMDASVEVRLIKGNYHFGSDAIESGIGSMTPDAWKTGTGLIAANVRNAATGLSDDGEIGFYYYDVSGGPSAASYMDIFAADLSGDNFVRVANGVASETEMKSPILAAAMNYVQDVSGGNPTWTQAEGSLPAVATPLQKPNYLLPVLAKGFGDGDNNAFASLDTDEKNAYGVRSLLIEVDASETPVAVTTANEGLIGYTDAAGHANQKLVDSLQAIMQALEEDGAAPYLHGEGSIPATITSNTVFTEPVDFIGVFLREGGKKTYEVAYLFCSGTSTIECTTLENSGKTLLFMSPLVSQISNGAESYTTLIPDAMVGGEELSWIVSFQNDAGEEVGQEFSGRHFATFSDAIGYAPSDAQKIVVGFYDLSEVPSMVVQNPSSAEFKLYMHGYNAAGEEESVSTDVTSDLLNVGVAYGSSFAAGDFVPPVGYSFESYSVSFTVTNPNEDRCQFITNLEPIETEDLDIASWEELALGLDNCTSKTWIVDGISPEKTIGLEQVELAKSRNTDATIWTDTFAVIPNYVAKPYTVVFNMNLPLVLNEVSYDLFAADDYSAPEGEINLEATNTRFPAFYGTSKDVEEVRLAGWTPDESQKNCVIHDDCSLSQNDVYNSLTSALIEEAGDAQTITLYPVWEVTRNNYMTVAKLVKNGPECKDYPINFTFAQDVMLNGSALHLSATSDSVVEEYVNGSPHYAYGVQYRVYANNTYTVDFSYDVTPGFKVSGVSVSEGYDEETHKISLSGNAPTVSASYSLLNYNVKLNVDKMDGDIFFGRRAVATKEMSYGLDNREFPRFYSRFARDGYENGYYYTDLYWGVKTGDGYEGLSPKFDADLVSRFEGNEYYTPAAAEGENASVTVYATDVIESASSTQFKMANDIKVYAVDGDGNLLQNGASDYHGSVVLTQTYDDDDADIHWSFEHASFLTSEEGQITRHDLYIPASNDTLVFKVSARPDPGYTMTIDPVLTYNDDDLAMIPTLEADAEDWGYHAETGILNVQPAGIRDMVFLVRFGQLSYNVAFSRPSSESGLFVGNKFVDDNYQMDWLEGATGVTAETIHAPALFNGEGCRIGWKVAGREVESRETTDIVSELPFMVGPGDDAANPVVNTLEPDEHVVANECDGTHELTLDVEGAGEVYFIQKIGSEPVGADDPEQTVVKHIFISPEENGPMMLTVPKVFDKNGTEVGVKLTVVAVPADGYVLNTLSYDVMFNGNPVTVLAQDSSELNILGDQSWHVKFEQYKPVYVTYDLALGEEDSSNVWIPADAVPSGSLQIGADGSDAPMWKPYRTDKCFSGWSMYDPNGPRPEVVINYTEVSTWNIEAFSSDITSPTKLYATWVEYGNGCSRPTTARLYAGTYYEGDDEYRMTSGDTILVSQKFGDAVFTHKAWLEDYSTDGDELVFAYNSQGYDVSFTYLPGPGLELDEDNPNAIVVNAHAMADPLVGEDGWFHLDAAQDANVYYVGFKENKIPYDFVFSANAGDEMVVYGNSWSATRTMKIKDNLPMGSVYLSDACFAGWSFSPNSSTHVGVESLTSGMLKDREERIAAGQNADTLFAMWNGGSDCRTGTLTLVLDASIQDLATVAFYQDLDGTGQKVFEMTGSDVVYLPSGPMPYEEGGTTRVDDDIFFSRVEVLPKVGVTLANEYQAFYVNESDETTENPLPLVAGSSEVEFGENAVIRVQGLSITDYSIAYHENAGDTSVFYGENWGATATLNVGGGMTMSLYRTDKCLAGWKLDDSSLVYHTADADFIAELAEREIEGTIDLYAVWSADDASCMNRIENVEVSLSNDLKNKATVELMQTVDGESKVVATVGAEGVSIPKMAKTEIAGEVTAVFGEDGYFSGLRVVPAAGYALDETVAPSYKVGNADAVELSSEPQPWMMTANTVISGAVNAVGYTVAFDVNAGNANVFYPPDWPENASAVSYDLGMDESARQFPKAYRTDKCLVGYGFSKDASRAESFAEFDSNFVKAAIAAGAEIPVLYAVWNECETPQTLYTVTLNEPVEGTLVLSQHDNSYEVPSNGFNVPAAPLGIVFSVSFNVNEGYKFNEDGQFTVDDGSGEFAVLEDNLLVVDGNKIVDAPADGKPYTFAFDVNVEEGENVFYGADWKESDNYALATEDVPFPKGVYRVGTCLAGWTIGKEATTVYTQYNATFVAAVENANKAGMPVSTLYAKWGDCETTQTVATVANADASAGTFTLSRTVSNTTVEYTVGETALQVPADEALDFTVSFAANKGYIYNSMNGISAVDASEASVEISGDVLNVAASLTLSAAVSPSTYIFVFKENAGDANVFYTGTPVENITVQITDDADARAFPMNLYRADACLVGWNFSETATTGFTEFDGDVVAAFDAANSGDLYAVWDAGCQQNLLTVYSADSGKGVLTLAQGNRSFVVGDDGLQVPETDDGIAFTVSFVPATGYAYDETSGFASFDPQGIPLGELENGSVTVKQAMSIAALGLAESEYAITFNMNAGDAKVYYGNPLEGANPKYTYTLADSAAFPMDFYRTDACIKGWTLLATPAETDRRFTKFNAEFAASVESAGDNYTGTLYADWGTCATTSNVTVAQAASEMGTLTLVQRDAEGEVVNSTEVKDEAVSLPLGKGDISFAVEFTPNPGFSKIANSYFYTVDANGNNLAALVNDKLTLVGNTIVKAPAKADAFAVAFDANAATGVNVFYGSGWNASGSYDILMSESERTFPTEIYRVGYKLVGWSLTKIADGAAVYYTSEGGPSGYENTYQKYDEKSSEVLQANGSSTVTMYAVWVPDAGQSTYAVALSNPNAGSLTLSQDVPGAQNFEVGSDELLVPFVQGGLVFHVSATLNSGYFANGSSLNLVDSDGDVLGSLQNGTLVVDEDKTLEIPVEADGVQFVFVENTKAHVFYENGWNNKGFFALEGETAFPTGLLRTDARLQGWAISRSSSKHYLDYNTQFVEDLRNYRSLGITVDTLYAVWDEYATIETEIVKSEGDRTGSFFISQTVNDVTTEPIEVTASGVEIPLSSKGITFNVNYEVKPGYRIASEAAITKSDISGEILGSTTNGGTLVLGQEQTLALDASVSAVPYKFAYNVNGGDANVFYGDNWSSTDDKTLDDESVALPNNIYRADAKLVGWSVDSNATEGSFDLTSEFVREMGDEGEVRTLYAVWEPAEVETYTVSFANTNVGSLVLTQDVEDTTVSFAVADSGLVVPVVEGGLRFKAAYTLKAGFSGSTDSLYVLDDLTGFLTSLTDGNLTVAEDVTLAIPTEGEPFNLVFHVNREKEVLFYGSDWKDSASYKLDDSTVSILLPAYLYTASACVVGWSLDRSGEGMAYTEFTSDFADILLSGDKKDVYDLYAVWGAGEECETAYDRVVLESENGSIRLVEPAEDNRPAVEHIFAVDNTIILPKVMNGNVLRVVSVPDSSFVLDSLEVFRDGSDDRQMLREGDALPFSLHGATLTAFFGKSNRTNIEFVSPKLDLSGNAVQFSFATSEFEVTRNVSAHIVLKMEGVSEPVADTVIADSIVPPYSGVWKMFPLAAGKYELTAELYDSKAKVDTTAVFEVKAEIAAVSADSWQMISLVNLDKDAMDWDDDDARFYWWDESTSMGDFWQYRAFSPDDEIEPTRGYWYSSLEGRPLVLKPSADDVLEDAVWNLDSINSGWNLVANPYGFSLNIYGENPHANRDPSEKSEVLFWRWNTEISDYEEAVVIKPYEAVWAEVRHSMDWKLPVEPEFVPKDSSKQDSLAPALSKRILAKAANNKNWTLQAVLSDLRGKKDAWNILGASANPFVTNEPPEGMGDRVNLSIVEGKRKLAKSVKAPADELEWDVELSATSDRVGELSFKGVESLREVGLKVFVTVDGKTTEMHEGETLRVNLTSFAKKATIRVAPGAKVVASFNIDALRYVKSGANVGVTFEASEGLAGSRTVVDILGMDGKVVSSRSATTLAGVNQLVLDAPKPGLYMLRVRAGSQMKAGRIMVK